LPLLTAKRHPRYFKESGVGVISRKFGESRSWKILEDRSRNETFYFWLRNPDAKWNAVRWLDRNAPTLPLLGTYW